MYNNLVTCFDYESKSDIEILLITHNKSFFVSNYTRVKLCSREQLFLILIQVYCYIHKMFSRYKHLLLGDLWEPRSRREVLFIGFLNAFLLQLWIGERETLRRCHSVHWRCETWGRCVQLLDFLGLDCNKKRLDPLCVDCLELIRILTLHALAVNDAQTNRSGTRFSH